MTSITVNQTSIYGYGTLDFPISSDTDPGHNHVVQVRDGKLWCSCPAFQYHPERPCKHMLRVAVQLLGDRVKYLEGRHPTPSEPTFESFDGVLEHLSMYNGDPELDYIMTIIMDEIEEHGETTADSVHVRTGDLFQKDPRIIGSAFGALQRKGYIRCVGYRKSTRKECHNRPIGVWQMEE